MEMCDIYPFNEANFNMDVAFDGCHKCYVIEDDDDMIKATATGYNILKFTDRKKFISWFKTETCELRFLDNWKLNKTFIPQGKI